MRKDHEPYGRHRAQPRAHRRLRVRPLLALPIDRRERRGLGGTLMKVMTCPLNGPRPVAEFAYGGEVRQSPDPDTCSDLEWSSYVFNRTGSPGMKYKRWSHIASG